jgi:hypothetical protein
MKPSATTVWKYQSPESATCSLGNDEMLAQHALVEPERVGLGHQSADIVAGQRVLPRLDHRRHLHALWHTDIELHRPALR